MLRPRCQFEQPDGSLECARRGIVFSRREELRAAAGSANVDRPQPAPAVSAASPEELKGRRWWQEPLLPAGESAVEPVDFWGRALLAVLLFAWGWRRRLPSTIVVESFERKNRSMFCYVRIEHASVCENIRFV